MKWFLFLLGMMFLLNGCAKRQPVEAETTDEAAAVVEEGDAWEICDPLVENPTEDAPLEVVGGLSFDAGVVLSGAKKPMTIPLKNTSKEPFWIYSIEADCSCTNVDGIPGGKKLLPGEEWPMRIIVDAGRISDGPFEKHLLVTPSKYKPIKIAVKGVVEGFVQCEENKARRIKFPAMKRADETWSASIHLSGCGSAEKILELEMPKDSSPKIAFQLEKTGEGSWKITASPTAPLPYSTNFATTVHFPVVKPENYPPVSVVVEGSVGATLRWECDHKTFLQDKDFDEAGNVHVACQLGHDVNGAFVLSPKSQKRVDAILDKVDWKVLFDTLEIEPVEGVQISKSFTERGVRLDVVFNKSIFQTKQRILIKTGCNGNGEFPAVLLKYKAPREKDEQDEQDE